MTDEVIFCESPEDVADAAAELIFEQQTEAVAERGVFRIALSGGSTPRLLYERLSSEEWRDEMSWEHWEVYWSDERAVPPDHPDSNFALAQSTLLTKVPLRKIFRMEADAANLQQAAQNYAQLLETNFGEATPVFDLILLGLGADGHTASLFPKSPALKSQNFVEAVIPQEDTDFNSQVSSLKSSFSPLPRLTLTYRVLNAARSVVFLISGEEKANAVKAILELGDPALPATHVKPETGECYWILDEAAAHLLE